MSQLEKLTRLARGLSAAASSPSLGVRRLSRMPEVVQASRLCENWAPAANSPGATVAQPASENPLWNYFTQHYEGPGIWKWHHYFECYHRHLQKFVGRPVHLAEVGVYSGGSLPMWRRYFGEDALITGVDIEPDCSAYEAPQTRILIGDQSDRSFWQRVRNEHPPFDVVIDDGGHQPHQQIITLDETLPYLKPGGVFICEDIQRSGSPFLQYVSTMADQLNHYPEPTWVQHPDLATHPATALQQTISSIHFYPYMVVIERTDVPVQEFVLEKRGTSWQPFF